MRKRHNRKRVLGASAVTLLALAGGTGIALAANPNPTPVTLTTSPRQVVSQPSQAAGMYNITGTVGLWNPTPLPSTVSCALQANPTLPFQPAQAPNSQVLATAQVDVPAQGSETTVLTLSVVDAVESRTTFAARIVCASSVAGVLSWPNPQASIGFVAVP